MNALHQDIHGFVFKIAAAFSFTGSIFFWVEFSSTQTKSTPSANHNKGDIREL